MKAGEVSAAAVALLLAAVGCGGASSAAGGAPVDTTEVGMVPHYRFDPPVIRVPAGEPVTWRNEDDFTHSVRVESDGSPTHVARPGESVRVTFDAPGEYGYTCTFHPHDMRGRVVVVPPD